MLNLLTSVGLGLQSACVMESIGIVTVAMWLRPLQISRREVIRFCGAWMNDYEIIISYARIGEEALAHFVSHKISLTNEIRSNNALPSHYSTNIDRRKNIVSLQGAILIVECWYSENPEYCPDPVLPPRCDFYLNQLLHKYQCNNLCQCPHCCVLLPVQANIGKVSLARISSHHVSLTCLLQLCRSVLLNQFWPTLKSMWTYYSTSTQASKM